MSSALDNARRKARKEKAKPPQSGEQAKAEPQSLDDIWPDPVPLDAPKSDAQPFPLEVLPTCIADLALAVSEAVNCPVDYPACSAVALMAGTIGALAVVQIKPGYRERAALYMGLVGVSNSGKSPPMKILQEPIIAEQSRRIDELAKLSEESLPTMYKHGEGELLVSDITAQELGMMLLKQPRGLTLTRDELIGWVNDLNSYRPGGKGSDRQFYLSVHDGTAVAVNRVGGRKIWCPRPTLTVLGGMQPDIIQGFLTIRDGFAERILFTFPEPKPPRREQWKTIPYALKERWSEALRRVRDLEMDLPPDETRPRSIVMEFGDDAKRAWEDHTGMLAELRTSSDFPEHMQSCYGKLDGYAARLALVLQLLDDSTNGANPRELTGRWMKAGAQLAMYFGAHAQRAYTAAGLVSAGKMTERVTAARRIVNWAIRHRMAAFIRSAAYRDLRGTFASPDDMAAPLKLLTQHNLIRYAPTDYRGIGRRPTPIFEVHPALLEGKVPGFEQPPPEPAKPASPHPEEDVLTHEYE